MNEEELTVSNEFTTFVQIKLDTHQKRQLVRYLNLHYLGDVECNKLDENGHFVAKYPEKETQAFKDAVWRSQTTHEYQVKVVYSVDGTSRLELP